MKTDKKEKNIDSILKVTKNVIQSTRNYNNYYINQKDNFYIDQLPLLTSPNSVNHSLSEEITKDEDYKTIRKAHIRSKNIPKLCPLYNEKGELLKKVAPSSKINIRNLYLNQLNIKDILAIDPFFSHQRYQNYGTLGNAFEEFLRDIFFGKKYSDLIYDEKVIFDNENYLNYINEKIEELKNESNISDSTFLESNYLFWKNKKKMSITINSLNISFEDINQEHLIHKKFDISLPFSLLPIFYIKGEEIFKKMLSSFLQFDEKYEKVELNYDNIYIYLRKNDNFTENKSENVINDIEELQKENLNNSLDEILNQQKENEIYLTEPQNQKNNNQNNNQNISDSIREMNRKKQKKLKELLPREDKMEYERSIKGNNEKLMNIAINATSGYKVMITASVDTTIEELLKIYVHKIKLPERVINNEIVFLFDGQKLDHTSQQEIGTAFKDAAIIIVVDIGEIIGA